MRAPKPQLISIYPQSVLRIFNIIEGFVPINMEFKSIKDLREIFNGDKFTIEEKYFISFYLEQYLNLNEPKSVKNKRDKRFRRF